MPGLSMGTCADCARLVIADAPADPENISMARGFSETAFCAAVSAVVGSDWLSMIWRSSFFPLMRPLALILSTATSAPAAPGDETLEKGPERSEISATL